MIVSFDIDAFYVMISSDNVNAFKRGLRIDVCKKKIRNSVKMAYVNGYLIKVSKTKHLHLGKYDTPVGVFSIFYMSGATFIVILRVYY